MIGYAGDGGGGMWQVGERYGVHDLAHGCDGHRVIDLTHDEADQALLRFWPVLFGDADRLISAEFLEHG